MPESPHAHFTFAELADAFGVSHQTVRSWRTGGVLRAVAAPAALIDRMRHRSVGRLPRWAVARDEVERIARARGVVVDLPDGTHAGDPLGAAARVAADDMRPLTPDERRRLRAMLRL